MVSVDHSSPPSPPPTNILCPYDKKRFTIEFEFSLEFENDDPPSLKPHHLSPFSLSGNKVHEKKDLLCKTCKHQAIICDYWCDKCNLAYHKECVECPPETKVPYHPKHPLQLRFTYLRRDKNCNCCGEYIRSLSYACSTCDFDLHTVCAIKHNILSINNPKRHDHTLTYFLRKNSLTCDVCALGDDKCFIYICYQCDFVVHKSCIYLPTTIRISRHEHRLSFTPSPSVSFSVPTKEWFCGVCRKRVDENDGSYTCVNGCNYDVHSKCATRRYLWDGKELEGEPEIEYENIKTFEEIGDGIIQHFSHPNHYMRLDKDEYKVDDEKKCQACLLAIYECNMYNCMKCDFILHKKCAHLPRRKLHQLHAHPLTLRVDHEGGTFPCHACEISGFGFSYACCEPNCYFELDVRCALVSEPFIHELHRRHPLFFTFEEGIYNECNFYGVDMPNLTCIKCDFDICFSCATFPNKVKYRNDEHFLTHFLSEEIVYIYCEICERKTDPSDGFYTCNVCSVTLHNECLLGEDRRLMKPGESIIINKVTLLIIPNDRLTRPICSKCKRHSPYRIAFITLLFGMLFCSMQCIENFGEKRLLELDERWKDYKDTPSENIDLVPPRYRRA